MRVTLLWDYLSNGIWRDTRNVWWVNILKTLNLSIKSFLDTELQAKARALTYRTMLAIVPALAMLFAIGRGFGAQTVIHDQLLQFFPAQEDTINQGLTFADSYLNQTGKGLFVGIGIAFLLWTLISLVSSVEDSFNKIWAVKQGRSLWRKITDYTAMFMILPVLMVCAGGLSLFVHSALHELLSVEFSPLVHFVLQAGAWVFTWLFFTAVYILIPNTRVKKTNALIAGIIAGSGFRLLQWLFISGQVYVSRYNAIYGSFAFLPLLLIWVQLTWVITLGGSVICYASQNIFRFSFQSEINSISQAYHRKVALALAASVVQNYVNGKPAPTPLSLSAAYGMPSQLVSMTTDILIDAKILTRVVIDDKDDNFGLQPAIDPKLLTIGYVLTRLDTFGRNNFIDKFDSNFKGVNSVVDNISRQVSQTADNVLLSELDITSDPAINR